jgi:hypothetical protein
LKKINTVQKEKIYITDLHFQHKVWINELSFSKEKLAIYQERLEDLASRNTDREMKLEQEQFQNRFIRQREVIDVLSHEVREHESDLVKFAKEHPVATDRVHFEDHTDMRDKMNTFSKLFTELKQDFHRFSAKWM